MVVSRKSIISTYTNGPNKYRMVSGYLIASMKKIIDLIVTPASIMSFGERAEVHLPRKVCNRYNYYTHIKTHYLL